MSVTVGVTVADNVGVWVGVSLIVGVGDEVKVGV